MTASETYVKQRADRPPRFYGAEASGLTWLAEAAGEFDDDEPPSRIHGDLWNGNVLWAADGVLRTDARSASHCTMPLSPF